MERAETSHVVFRTSIGEIAEDNVFIDNAMKWGFGWEVGPFETWDAIGLEKSVERMQEEGEKVPDWVLNLLKDGHKSFYKEDNGSVSYFDQGRDQYKP